MRRLTLLALLLVTVLCCQCSFKWGTDFTSFQDDSATGGSSASAASSTSGGGEEAPLPEPETWYVPPPPLTPEQQLRKDEVDQYLAYQYRDYDILEATQGYSGDIFYWVDPNTIPGSFLTPPPPSWTAQDLVSPAGAEIGRTELELYPELRGAAGTPIPRPDYSRYIMGMTGATSVQDLANHQVSGQPSGQTRLYAGLHSLVPNRGASATFNQFQGDVEDGTFSLLEVAVVCPFAGDTTELIGVALSRDRLHGDDAKVRLHVEYTTTGGASFGDLLGGWDEKYVGFVPYHARPYGPGVEVPASMPGFGTQKEHRLDIFQSPAGDWWIAHNGNLLGYYPASLFKLLNTGACRAAYYGEIYDGTPTDWTWSDMGSGEFASAGWGYASYVRDPSFQDSFYSPWYPGDCTDPNICYARPFDNNCYTRSTLTMGMPPWSRYFYLGGPGGDAPGCD
jgi:hypothetical protein